jgi:S-adenosylmethionine/arginine decarboxylase-like enzyme
VGIAAITFESMPDLAPTICRQRLVIEGTCDTAISADDIRRYLVGLSEICEMKILLDPVTHRSDRFGWSGWIHWEGSGAHLYAWDTPVLFFSVDVYTCKVIDIERAFEFTAEFFRARQIVSKAF